MFAYSLRDISGVASDQRSRQRLFEIFQKVIDVLDTH